MRASLRLRPKHLFIIRTHLNYIRTVRQVPQRAQTRFEMVALKHCFQSILNSVTINLDDILTDDLDQMQYLNRE